MLISAKARLQQFKQENGFPASPHNRSNFVGIYLTIADDALHTFSPSLLHTQKKKKANVQKEKKKKKKKLEQDRKKLASSKEKIESRFFCQGKLRMKRCLYYHNWKEKKCFKIL